MAKEETTLRLPSDMVESIVRNRLNAEVVAAFGGQDKLMEKLIDNLIRQPVDDKGKPVLSSHYSNKGTLLDYLARDILQKELSEAIRDWFKENAEKFREELTHQLSKKSVQKEIAVATILGLKGAAENKYNYFFRFSFNMEEKED